MPGGFRPLCCPADGGTAWPSSDDLVLHTALWWPLASRDISCISPDFEEAIQGITWRVCRPCAQAGHQGVPGDRGFCTSRGHDHRTSRGWSHWSDTYVWHANKEIMHCGGGPTPYPVAWKLQGNTEIVTWHPSACGRQRVRWRRASCPPREWQSLRHKRATQPVWLWPAGWTCQGFVPRTEVRAVCFRCHKLGHIPRECPEQQDARETSDKASSNDKEVPLN